MTYFSYHKSLSKTFRLERKHIAEQLMTFEKHGSTSFCLYPLLVGLRSDVHSLGCIPQYPQEFAIDFVTSLCFKSSVCACHAERMNDLLKNLKFIT